MTADISGSAGGNTGIYDSFPGYRLPDERELATALQSALIVIDANVLLDLYRYNDSTRGDLLGVLRSFGERLWVPHQAVHEFWRNRIGVMAARNVATNDALAALSKQQRATADALLIWAKAKAIPVSVRDDLLERVDALHEDLADQVESYSSATPKTANGSPDEPVLLELATLLLGKVGRPLDAEGWRSEVAEGNRRVRDKEPPGYGDGKKLDSDLPEGAAGDYLVWCQTLKQSTARELDVVFVTSDTKEDWWWRYKSDFLGPRTELVVEMNARCGQRLYLMQPSDLLKRASAVQIAVSDDSVDDVERVSRESQGQPSWTAEGVNALLGRLDVEGLAQAEVIRMAARGGGQVDRETVYAISGRGNEQMLRGFTRPTARITGALQDLGVVAMGVQAALTPSYGGGVKALAFRIPGEMVEILASNGAVGEPA